MKEIDLQSMIVRSVRANAGFAAKMAHRFFVGLPDLIVQIPGYRTSLWEVKRNPEPYLGTKIKLVVTPAQYACLDSFYRAGGICGVISFLVGKQNLQVGVFDMFKVHAGVYANDKHYTLLPRGHREEGIMKLLLRELDRHGTIGLPLSTEANLRGDGRKADYENTEIPTL